MNGSGQFEVRAGLDQRGNIRPYLLSGGLPLLLPNLWISSLPTRRENTLDAYARDLVPLLEWAREMGSSIEGRFRDGLGFKEYELSQIAKRMTSSRRGKPLAISTINRRIEALRSFFDFSFDYACEVNDVSLDKASIFRVRFSTQEKKLFKKMRAYQSQSPEPGTSEELSEAQVELLMSVVHPLSELNPFTEMCIRVRNYCMIKIALETLARRAELALMEVSDVVLGIDPEVTIKSPSAKVSARRRDKASLKTKGRTVPISGSAENALGVYLHEYRDELLKARRPTTALFVSSRDGRRLTIGAVNQMLSVVSAVPEIATAIKRLHPHSLRVAGANRARREMKKGGISSVDQIESLSVMGGWRQDSPMVRKYTRAALSENLKIVAKSEEK